MIAVPPLPGTNTGTTNLISTSSSAAATPGQSRSGFRGTGGPVGFMDISVQPHFPHQSRMDYSDLSASRTLTRDARAAGIKDATPPAVASTAAAKRIVSAPGRRMSST